MSAIGHVMILASAGSGKTYALTNRFVRLLALGAKPERIVALTFTRKAAGEFFDEILNKLAGAASDPAAAARLAEAIAVPGCRAGDFLKMLRAVADAMHRLRLGTFDGFFARVARNFPLELGLAGEFEILQSHAARRERSRVLRRMFGRAGELGEAQREFIEAFKRATFGVDEKRLGAQLDAFLDQHQEIFLEAAQPGGWGNARSVWPEGSEWLGAEGERGAALQALHAALGPAEMDEKQRGRWEAFFAALSGWVPGAELPKPVAYLLGNTLDAWPALETIVIERKKFAPPPAVREALRTVVRAIVGEELARRLQMTRGIHAVLSGYEAVYHEAVRRAGKLTFGDVQRLLAPGEDGARTLSRAVEEGNRLFIDFRLDAEIEHWLLDEFQDTSFGQWSVLQNLIDEAVQDPTGARSFFYVGDVKQSVFAWRGGDPRLFREIFDRYNHARAGVIAEEHLEKSYRSGPPVIAMVNAVFGAAGAIAELFPGAASAAWNREWRAHESAKPELGGHVALLHADDEEGRFALALRILHEIEPLERGLTCALLVQKNETGARLADYLRREGGVPAVAEADLRVGADNPPGAALLALVKAAAHPGDTLAREHLKMSPLGALLAAEGMTEPESLTRGVLAQIHADGFERTMDFWLRRLEPDLAADDAFNRERARRFVAAAAEFDATGSRDLAEFIQFMEGYTVREADTAGVVRVLTVHKAKGLGFDLVILPDLEGTKLDALREGKLAVQRATDRSVDWVLDLPAKLFLEHDPVLSAHVGAAEAAECYEKLSLLYVAMTRAKRAMYLITKPPGKSTSRNFPKLLAKTLGDESATVRIGKLALEGTFAEGRSDWHTAIVPPPPVPVIDREVSLLDPGSVLKSRRLLARRPSEGKSWMLEAASIFTLTGGTAADVGTAIHALLAEVEWAEADEAAKRAARWMRGGVEGAQAAACLQAPELAAVWARPPGPGLAAVWREQAFEIVLDGVWVTGVFDRVVIERDEIGRTTRVTVFDFKTDQISDESGVSAARVRYAPQLELYRRVAAVLTGVGTEKIEAHLVLTRLNRLVTIERSPG